MILLFSLLLWPGVTPSEPQSFSSLNGIIFTEVLERCPIQHSELNKMLITLPPPNGYGCPRPCVDRRRGRGSGGSNLSSPRSKEAPKGLSGAKCGCFPGTSLLESGHSHHEFMLWGSLFSVTLVGEWNLRPWSGWLSSQMRMVSKREPPLALSCVSLRGLERIWNGNWGLCGNFLGWDLKPPGSGCSQEKVTRDTGRLWTFCLCVTLVLGWLKWKRLNCVAEAWLWM